MNESERLADQYERSLNGNAWYGPSLKENLEGINREAALQRPIAEGHSIAEIALHLSTWNDVVRRRIDGESPAQPTDAEDWPKASFATEADWQATKKRALETGNALAASVRRFAPAKLQEQRPGLDDTWYNLIAGSLEHVLYHSGQIGLLRKAAHVPA